MSVVKLFFNKAIKILLATNALILFAGAMFGPIYAFFVEEIGGDLLDASATFAVFAFAAGTTSLISGKYSDKFKENELILVFGYAIMGIGFFAYMLVSSILSLLFVQAIIGLGEAIYAPAFDVVYSKHLDRFKSGRAWGAWEAMDYFTTALGAIVGGIIATKFGFNILFVIMALLCFSSAFYIYRLPRRVL